MSADAKDAGRKPHRARRVKRALAGAVPGNPMYSFHSGLKPLIDFTAHAAQ
ncbi:hypothetical protein ACQVRV_18925 (plasmid) [Ralstonia pseudosolanacearum]